MWRLAGLIGLAVPLGALAQPMPQRTAPDAHAAMHGATMQHAAPIQPGQGAFGAIAEIVTILDADPATNWSMVNIEALRQHLIDMDNVTLRAAVRNETIEGGMRFVVTGDGAVRGSIQRMVRAHAAEMNGVGPWRYEALDLKSGAELTVHVPSADMAKLRGLGFIGVMTLGVHHQLHHLMIAAGEHPHD